MTTRYASALPLLLILIALPPGCGHAQPAPTKGGTVRPAAQRPKGFLDYSLGKINPEQRDYGAQLGSMRSAVATYTVDDLFFWSNAFTLFLLTGVSIAFHLHLRSSEKKETVDATIITELWNSRVSDRMEIASRTEEYNRLVEQRNKAIERALALHAKASEDNADARTQKKVDRLIEGPRTGTGPEKGTSGPQPSKPRSSGGTPSGGNDVLQENILLTRRIEAMENTAQNLRERLNQSESLREQERKRNQTLKGA